MKYHFWFSFFIIVILASCGKDKTTIDRSGIYSGMMHTVASWTYLDTAFHVFQIDTSYSSKITVNNIGSDSIEFVIGNMGHVGFGNSLPIAPGPDLIFIKQSSEIYSAGFISEHLTLQFSRDTLFYLISGGFQGVSIGNNFSGMK